MLEPGTPIGLYVVDAFLGEGSVGMVYRVCDASRAYALKVLSHGGEEAVARFQQEAEIQVSLDHPHIVRGRELLEVGGRPALLMDYVHGLPLDDWLALNPTVSITVRDRVAGQILDAVAYAHDHGLVHRDLKPANVLVEEHAEGPRARVTDFGLAKPARSVSATQTGLALGSPRYVAPEQLRDAKRVDARADVWSLGALLYELYTGRRAFAQPTMLDVMTAVAAGRYPDPPNVPPRVREAIRGAMQVDPTARFQDCRALKAALGVASAESFLPALGSPILPTSMVSGPAVRSVTLVPPEASIPVRMDAPSAPPRARGVRPNVLMAWGAALLVVFGMFAGGMLLVAVLLVLGVT